MRRGAACAHLQLGNVIASEEAIQRIPALFAEQAADRHHGSRLGRSRADRHLEASCARLVHEAQHARPRLHLPALDELLVVRRLPVLQSVDELVLLLVCDASRVQHARAGRPPNFAEVPEGSVTGQHYRHAPHNAQLAEEGSAAGWTAHQRIFGLPPPTVLESIS